MPGDDSPASQTKLIEEFLANAPAAVAKVSGWARAVAGHRAWGFETPEDIVQTTLLAVVRNFREGRFTGGELAAYVRVIAKNLCVSAYRRERRRGIEVPLQDDAGPGASVAAGGLDPEQVSLLERILERLDEACRDTIALAYLQGLSRHELAERWGISEVAAKVRLFRCLEKARGFVAAGGSS